MLLQKESTNDLVHIKAYTKGKITLNIGEFTDFVFLKNSQLINLELSTPFEEINAEFLDILSENKPEVLIIGTGDTHKILDLTLIKYLNDKGIAIEAMASRQACHTYQVLSHDRRIVNALIYA